jgi:hypothetical protein
LKEHVASSCSSGIGISFDRCDATGCLTIRMKRAGKIDL